MLHGDQVEFKSRPPGFDCHLKRCSLSYVPCLESSFPNERMLQFKLQLQSLLTSSPMIGEWAVSVVNCNALVLFDFFHKHTLPPLQPYLRFSNPDLKPKTRDTCLFCNWG